MFKTVVSLVLWPIWYMFFIPSLIFLFSMIVLLPKNLYFLFIRPLCWLYCILAGQWLRKENNPPPNDGQPYIYMFNHASMFDQFMIAAYIPHYITAVAANETFRYPIFGYIIKQYGVIPIIRHRIKEAIGSLTLAEKALKEGISFIISPEGTRTTTGELGPFKKGPFHLAKNTGATIVPIGLLGGFRAKKKENWRLELGILTTRFGNPIKQNEYGQLEVEEISALVRKKIKKLIEVGD